jgi:hypothetical protein
LGGPGSSVGIATGYEPNGPGYESRRSTVHHNLFAPPPYLNTEPVKDVISLEFPRPLAGKTQFCFGFRGNTVVTHSPDETLK